MYLSIKKAMLLVTIALCMVMATVASANSQVIAILEEADTAMRALGGNLDRYNGGGELNCQEFLMYTDVLEDVQYPDVSGIWVDLHAIYVNAAEHAVDAVEGVAETCQNTGATTLVSGAISDLNYGKARMGINEALEKLRPALLVAAEQPVPTATPEPTMVPEPTEEPMPEPTEEMPMPEPTEAPVATPEAPSCVVPASGPWPDCAKNGEPYTQATPVPAGTGCVIPETGPWPECAKTGQPVSTSTTADDDFELAIPLPPNSSYEDSYSDEMIIYTSDQDITSLVAHFNRVLPAMGYAGYIDTRPYEENGGILYPGVFRNVSEDQVINVLIIEEDNESAFQLVLSEPFEYELSVPTNSNLLVEDSYQVVYGTDLEVEAIMAHFNQYFSSMGYTGELTVDSFGDYGSDYSAVYLSEEKALAYQVELVTLGGRSLFAVSASEYIPEEFEFDAPIPEGSEVLVEYTDYIEYSSDKTAQELIEFYNTELPKIGFIGEIDTEPYDTYNDVNIYYGEFFNKERELEYDIQINETVDGTTVTFSIDVWNYYVEEFEYNAPIPDGSEVLVEYDDYIAYSSNKTAQELIEFYNIELPKIGFIGEISNTPVIEEDEFNVYYGEFFNKEEELEYDIQIVETADGTDVTFSIDVWYYYVEEFGYDVPVAEGSTIIEEYSDSIAFSNDKSVLELRDFYNNELMVHGFTGHLIPRDEDDTGVYGWFFNEDTELNYNVFIDSVDNGSIITITAYEYYPDDFEYDFPAPENSNEIHRTEDHIGYTSNTINAAQVIEFYNQQLPAIGLSGEINSTPNLDWSNGFQEYTGSFINIEDNVSYEVTLLSYDGSVIFWVTVFPAIDFNGISADYSIGYVSAEAHVYKGQKHQGHGHK